MRSRNSVPPTSQTAAPFITITPSFPCLSLQVLAAQNFPDLSWLTVDQKSQSRMGSAPYARSRDAIERPCRTPIDRLAVRPFFWYHYSLLFAHSYFSKAVYSSPLLRIKSTDFPWVFESLFCRFPCHVILWLYEWIIFSLSLNYLLL